MLNELLTMSKQELKRIQVIRQVIDKKCTQQAATKELGLSKRQVIRLVKAVLTGGDSALLSKQRGKTSNRAHTSEFKLRVKDIVQHYYADFGPTFAAEKLLGLNKITINKETLRQWMNEWGLWKANPRKVLKLQQGRVRRPSFGELIQIDGSHHDWFEGRGDKCCLLVFIDDATSRIVGLRFEEEETTAGYFTLCRSTLETYGRPLAYYSDKFGVFRVNQKDQEDKETQFGRALRELGIELICAHSPQAKGRVERANGTLQDRLVKEMRLRNISALAEANAYLPEFISDHNKRFAVTPKNDLDAHRSEMPSADILNLIFSIQHERKLSKQLECSYEKRVFQIQGEGNGYRLQHKRIIVSTDMQGKINIMCHGKILAFKEFDKKQLAPEIINAKSLEKKVDSIKVRIKQAPPSKKHPWKSSYAVTADKKLGRERRSSYPQAA
jgi:hypothetical protein